MALRHSFPQATLPNFQQAEEPTRAPMIAKPPKPVRFRDHRDLPNLSRELIGFSNVQLCASVGAGKSTRMPREMAIARGMRVVHVVPSRLLAVHLYDYLSTQDTGVTYHLALAPEDGCPGNGVVITYSANVCALLLQYGIRKDIKPMGDCMLFLDESHESDAYTYTLSKLAHLIPGVVGVMSASATHGADKVPMRETEGVIESQSFPCEKPSSWDPLDAGKPWSIAALPGNALLYVDSEIVAKELVTKYNRAGVTAFRLSAKMPVEAFRDAMRALNDPRSGIIVFVADYSFRSGFTFNVQSIIDSCLVQYVEVENGETHIKTRVAYNLEKEQASGRGARTAGTSCVYHYPKVDIGMAICKLEGVEMDAAATMFRYLGYAVPAEIAHAIMAKGNLPVDFESSANGVTPLMLLPANDLAPLVNRALTANSGVEAPSPTLTEVINGYTAATPPDTPVDYFSDAVAHEPEPARPKVLNGLGFLQQLREMSGAANTLVPGTYYACPSVPNADVVSRLYGTDWRSAVREVLANDHLAAGFSTSDRVELVAMILAEYNRAVAVKSGLEVMLQSQDSLTSLAARYPKQVHDWSEVVGADMRDAEARINSFIEVLQRLRTDSVKFVPVQARETMEQRVAQQYASRLRNAIGALRGKVSTDDYLKYIESKIDDVPDAPDEHHDKLQVETSGESETAYVKVVPTQVGRRHMVDLYVKPAAGTSWKKRDYKVMLATYIKNRGIDVSVVRSLQLMYTRLSGNQVLQELRDDPDYLQREASKFSLRYDERVRRLLKDT